MCCIFIHVFDQFDALTASIRYSMSKDEYYVHIGYSIPEL